MGKPELLYEEDPEYPGEVACMASFVPTFETRKEPQEDIEVNDDEKPEEQDFGDSDKYYFIFIVDRSYSMSG